MDNVCHTLVGLAAARAGLNTTTRFATATLAIAANLPDIDVLAFASSVPAVALRRGWTHGVLAQVLLPVALATVMWGIARARPARHADARQTSFLWLTILACVGVFTHVFLDYLNNYGVRLLMPLDDRWFYGDAVFIIDVWLWAMLGVGVVFTKALRRWPARAGLAAASIYVAAMLLSARSAHSLVADRWAEATGAPPASLMVGPVPINPLRKSVIVDAGEHYVTGSFTWFPRRIAFDPAIIPKRDTGPWIAQATAQEPDFAAILVWARFPYWEVEIDGQGTRVTLRDMRFRFGRVGFGASTYLRQRERAAR